MNKCIVNINVSPWDILACLQYQFLIGYFCEIPVAWISVKTLGFMKVSNYQAKGSNNRWLTFLQVYNAYQALLSGLGKMLQVCHSASATIGSDEYVRGIFWIL